MSAVHADAGSTTREPVGGVRVRASRARRWPWWLALAGVIAIAGSVLLAKAAVYQPLGWGQDQFVPVGVGIRPVNQFGDYRYDYYVPPQRGIFTFVISIRNNGSRPVIIEGLRVDALAVRLAEPVRYTTAFYTGNAPVSNQLPSGSPVLHDVTLGAGKSIAVAIAMRTAQCASRNAGWTSIQSFFVKERFLFFTHTVALPWSMDGGALIMHVPGGRPGPGAICAPR